MPNLYSIAEESEEEIIEVGIRYGGRNFIHAVLKVTGSI